MTIDIEEFAALSAPERFHLSEPLSSWDDPSEEGLELDSVEAIARSLDRLRRMCARIGPMTLRAEVFGVPTEVICAALDEISLIGERVLERCLEP